MLNLKPSSIWKPVWVSTQLLKDHIFQGVRNGVSDIIYHSGYTLRPKHVTGWAASRKKQISQLHGSVNFCRGHSKTSIKLTEKKRTNINVESDGYLKPKGADICHLWAEFKNSKKQKQKTNLPSGILPNPKLDAAWVDIMLILKLLHKTSKKNYTPELLDQLQICLFVFNWSP